MSGLDVQVGWVLKQLEQDGLADNTVVIFFADNGRLEARGLDWCYDSGLHVPLIIRWPRDYPPPAQLSFRNPERSTHQSHRCDRDHAGRWRNPNA